MGSFWADRANRLWLLALLVGVGLGFVPWAVSITEPPPLQYGDQPFAVLNDPVPAGADIVLAVHRCNQTDALLPYSITRQLVHLDSGEPLSRALPTTGSFLAPGCEDVLSTVTAVPADTLPGRYQLRALSLVKGRWRTFTVPWESAPFTVVRGG